MSPFKYSLEKLTTFYYKIMKILHYANLVLYGKCLIEMFTHGFGTDRQILANTMVRYIVIYGAQQLFVIIIAEHVAQCAAKIVCYLLT